MVLIPLNAEKMNNVKEESASVIPDGEYSAYKAGLNYPNSTEEVVLADGDYLTAGLWVIIILLISFGIVVLMNLFADSKMKNIKKW